MGGGRVGRGSGWWGVRVDVNAMLGVKIIGGVGSRGGQVGGGSG